MHMGEVRCLFDHPGIGRGTVVWRAGPRGQMAEPASEMVIAQFFKCGADVFRLASCHPKLESDQEIGRTADLAREAKAAT